MRIYLGFVCAAVVLMNGYAWASEDGDEKSNVEMEVYGKIHVSLDAVNNGDTGNTNLSSNSSRIGFRGSKDLIRELKAIWQLETTVEVDGESSELIPRNRYAGISGDIGSVIVGNYDTPFNSLARTVDIFNETLGDNRSLLGSRSSDGTSLFNVRARNAMLYKSPLINGVQLQALYSPDYSGNDEVSAAAFELSSVSLSYDQGPVLLAGSYEQHFREQGFRLAARVKSETAFASFIFESLSTEGGGTPIDRNAYAFNGAYHIGLISFALQYIVVDDFEEGDNSGANMIAAGVFQSLSKNTRVYLVAAGTSNKDAAKFDLAGGGGHGENTAPFGDNGGVNISGVSLGLIHKF